MVFDRGAAQRQPVVGLEEAGRFGGGGGRVLDRLRLVQDGVVEPELREVGDVAAQGAVGGEDHVVLLEVGAGSQPGAGVVEDLELGRKPLGLRLPVEHQRAGDDDQRRSGVERTGLPPLPPVLQQRKHLDRLSQAHVVGQAAAETELL
jgi:hypothetical protein